MKINIEKLYQDELMMLNSLLDEFEIPGDVFKECGSSALILAAARSSKNDDVAKDHLEDELVKEAELAFDRLCKSAPNIPPDALRALSVAYGAFAFLTTNGTEMGGRESYGSMQSQVKVLIAMAMSRGFAMGKFGMSVEAMQAMQKETMRKESLAQAGAKGAAAKHKGAAELKAWALQKAASMRGADADIARKLSAQIPADLADVSKSPERFIYDALRSKSK